MPDHVYLSVWLQQHDEASVFKAWRAALQGFPYSQSFPGVRSFSVHPVDWSEPVAVEEDFPAGAEVDMVLATTEHFRHPDCAYQAVVCWDLSAGPKVVKIIAYGPDFEGREDERGHLEFDLGVETPFLGDQHNISLLIAFNRKLADVLPLHKRHLWTESGANFADKVAEALE